MTRVAGCRLLPAAVLLLLPACTAHLFSGVRRPDFSRPVVTIETRAGHEQGVATSEGILFLGRTAQSGPCRVHYFLGDTPMVDDGEITRFGSVLCRADVDLAQQQAALLGREPTGADQLVILIHGMTEVVRVPVQLAAGDGIAGDLLVWPGRPVPPGAGIFAVEPESERLLLVGLVAGAVELEAAGNTQRYLAFSGSDALRQGLAQPQPWPPRSEVRHRPDDISVRKRT